MTMTMTRLYVYLLQGTNWTAKDSYVKFQLGNLESKTRVFKNTTSPIWNEEFVFRVHDLVAELLVSVYHHHDSHSGFFNRSADLVGRVRIPLSSVANEDNNTLPPTWFSLEKPKNMKSIGKDNGKILLSLSLHGRSQEASNDNKVYLNPSIANGNSRSCETSRISPHKSKGKHLMKSITGRFERLFSKNEEPSKSDDSSELSTTISDECTEEISSTCSFEEPFENMNSINENGELPDNLQGGVLHDQTYLASPNDLNKFIFSSNSKFQKDLAELQGTKDVHEGPWIYKLEEEAPCLARVITYTKAASKLVKSVKATEEQSYLKANGKEFAVFVSVSTPDVPYGSTFKIELLYKITPGPESSFSGQESSRVVISWGIHFVQNTMMRCMIEGGARQGLKDNFDQFADLLAQNFEIMKSEDVSDKDKTLANLEIAHQSYWELAIEYFCNFTVFSTICMVLYVFMHILLCTDNKVQGLEFPGLNLPDNFGELITAGIIVLHLERVYDMATHFVQATLQRRSDHGVKSQGDGWVLTVALIEATNLASLSLEGSPDPYVMLSCNGKTRTSSVKLQTVDPQWNEILEFDAAEEPPSVLDVEVFDFDGPFDQATSLGHAEINFLKHTSTELADIWVPLEGKLAKSSQSKLHLRIFLDNNNGVETIKDYLTKMEKEVGKKLNLRSPHRNSTFQKIFGLPPEEFLISDFTCSLKRKMPLQGKLFLSARMVGFYANLFGHKTKFFFLWEDIEDIQVLPPSLASVGSPLVVIMLRPGRGVDAKHGAKTQDDQGRLHFHFHSFVSFNAASRTIMALWKTRTLSPYQKAEIVVEHEHEDGESLLMVEDAEMTKVYSTELHVNMTSLMQIFYGGDLEHRVMSKSGCLNYIATNWEHVGLDIYERRLCYKFNRHISIFGGEVTCTQQKSPTVGSRGWIINEIMVLHDVPFGDHFRVKFRYEVESSANNASSCKCDVYLGVVFLKSSKFQQRIIRNVTEKFGQRLREIFEHVEKEILLGS